MAFKIYPLACANYSFELLESILSIMHNVLRSKLEDKVID
jgi:hypothetical protein